MKNTKFMALGFLGIIVLWMISGVWASIPKPEAEPEDSTTTNLMKVSTVDMAAKLVSREIVLQGELEPIQQVDVLARTASNITTIIKDKGSKVSSDEPLMLLDIEDRKVRLQSAMAAIDTAELELNAAKKMRIKGLQSDNRVKSLEASLAQAKANLAAINLELNNLEIKAPFSGVIESRHFDLGSRVDVGDRLMTLVDESVIKAVGYIPQQSVSKLSLGQSVFISLLDGRQAEGVISFVARVGDQETHAFRVEAEIPNHEGLLNAGTSAQIRIRTGEELAHFISPSVFALDDSGEVGVKTVGTDNLVEFYPIQIIRTEPNGFWVSGLPEVAEVITLGQGFVIAGENVIPVPVQ